MPASIIKHRFRLFFSVNYLYNRYNISINAAQISVNTSSEYLTSYFSERSGFCNSVSNLNCIFLLQPFYFRTLFQKQLYFQPKHRLFPYVFWIMHLFNRKYSFWGGINIFSHTLCFLSILLISFSIHSGTDSLPPCPRRPDSSFPQVPYALPDYPHLQNLFFTWHQSKIKTVPQAEKQTYSV